MKVIYTLVRHECIVYNGLEQTKPIESYTTFEKAINAMEALSGQKINATREKKFIDAFGNKYCPTSDIIQGDDIEFYYQLFKTDLK